MQFVLRQDRRCLVVLLLAALTLSVACSPATAAPRLLYSQSFDEGPLPGVVGKAGKDFKIDARGRIDMERGTLAFFTQSKDDAVDQPDFPIGGVEQSLEEGYFFSVMSFERWRTEFLLLSLDAGRYAPPLRLPPVIGRWKAGQWHHLAVVWDRNEGITAYEDGRRIASNWGKYHWQFSLPPKNLFFTGAVDEVRVYGDCLTDVQVAQLAKVQDPQGDPIAPASADAYRDRELARMGWSGDSLAALPVVKAEMPAEFNFARMTGCWDAKWRTGVPFDGEAHTTWPHIYYASSLKGRHLDITMAPAQRYDRVRAVIQRPYTGDLRVAGSPDPLLPMNIAEPAIVNRRLPQTLSSEKLVLNREQGQLGELDFYRVDPVKDQHPQGETRAEYFFGPADAFPDSDLGKALQTETPVLKQKPVAALSKGDDIAPWSLSAGPFGGFQAFTPAPTDSKAYSGAWVTLVAEGIRKPTPVHITIKEPVYAQRDWLVADAVLQPSGEGRQVFRIKLTGRPVINTPPMTLAADPAKPKAPAVQIPGVGFGITVTAADAVNWQMGRGGSSVAFLQAEKSQVLPAAVEDQLEYARQAFSTLMEIHAHATTPRCQIPLRWLAMFAPDRREVKSLLRRTGLIQPFEGYKPPASEGFGSVETNGAPEWAAWQRQAMNKLWDHVNWRINNMQLPTGEYGATFNDDTDYVENWIDYALAIDDDGGTIKNSLCRFWNGLWKYGLDEGVGRYTTDDGHFAEEGSMSLAMAMLVNYGDPTTVERVMAAASHVEKWRAKTDKGYRMVSTWVNPEGMWTDGKWGDVAYGHRSDLLIPDGYLVWYNQFAPSAEHITSILNNETPDWKTRAPVSTYAAVGFIEWAGAWLRDPGEVKRQCADMLKSGKISGNLFLDSPQWLAESGIPEGWNPKQPAFQPQPPLVPYCAWGNTEMQWYGWKLTGDIRFLVNAYQRTAEWFNNLDYAVTEAMPSADRIAEPREAVICSRIGARAANRGAAGLCWPHHAISYEKGARQMAALVTDNMTDRLGVRFYAFTDQPLELDARVWRLWPGTYKLKLSYDRNDDGQPEETILEKEIHLQRGAPLHLTLPAKQCAVLSLTPVQIAKPQWQGPDLAISVDTVDQVYQQHLLIHVHNLGSQPAKDVLVRIRDRVTGELLPMGEQRIPLIEAPLDFKPRSRLVQVDQIYAIAKGVIIEVDPDGKTGDTNPYNNRLELSDGQVFGNKPIGPTLPGDTVGWGE